MEPQFALKNVPFYVSLFNNPEPETSADDVSAFNKQLLSVGRSGYYSPDGGFTAYFWEDDIPANSIAILSIEYEMWRWSSMFFSGFIDRLAANGNVAAVVMAINSPGGSVSGLDALAQSIKNCDEVKPVIAWVNDGSCCSGAYWIASQARAIYASNQHCYIGSIGTMLTWLDWSEYLKKAGIKEEVLYATASTEKNKAWRDQQEGNSDTLRQYLDSYNAAFQATVKAGRGSKLKAANTLNGQTYHTPEALKYGLIDGVKSWVELLAFMGDKEAVEALKPATVPATEPDKPAAQEEAAELEAQGNEPNQSATNPLINMKLSEWLMSFLGLSSNEVSEASLASIEEAAKKHNDELAAKDKKISDLTASITKLEETITSLQEQVKTLGSEPAKEKQVKDEQNTNPLTKEEPEPAYYSKVRQFQSLHN